MKQMELEFEQKIYYNHNGLLCLDNCKKYEPEEHLLLTHKSNNVKIGSGYCMFYCKHCKDYSYSKNYVICDIK